MNIVFIIVGLFLILIGLILWKLKIAWIINGFSSKEIETKEWTAAWVGRKLILMGMLVLLLAALEEIFPTINKDIIILLYTIIVIGMAILIRIGIYRNNKDK